MVLRLMAWKILLDAIFDAVFLEIAIEGSCVADRYRHGARTYTELLGFPPLPHRPVAKAARERSVRVRVDLWIVELIEELVESQEPSHVRAFVQEAVLAYVDNIAASGPASP